MRQLVQYVPSGEVQVIDTEAMRAGDFLHYSERNAPLSEYDLLYDLPDESLEQNFIVLRDEKTDAEIAELVPDFYRRRQKVLNALEECRRAGDTSVYAWEDLVSHLTDFLDDVGPGNCDVGAFLEAYRRYRREREEANLLQGGGR